MPNDDLISRAAARDVINTWGRHENEDVRMDLLHNDLNAIPAVDAVRVVHGQWIVPVPGDGAPYCSACKCDALADGYWLSPTLMRYYKTPFCPNCGAKMDGGDDNAPD